MSLSSIIYPPHPFFFKTLHFTGAISNVATSEIIAFQPIGHYSLLDKNATETVELIGDESYVFTIEDSFGDGLSQPSPGSYEIWQGETKLVSGSGNFGSSESTGFTTLPGPAAA